jgi:hypothetical protein
MMAGCLNRLNRKSAWTLLVAVFILSGCQQADPLRQGFHSTYNQELKQLAEETSRKALAKGNVHADGELEDAADARSGVVHANYWPTPSLLNAVHLRAPVPLDAGMPGPP